MYKKLCILLMGKYHTHKLYVIFAKFLNICPKQQHYEHEEDQSECADIQQTRGDQRNDECQKTECEINEENRPFAAHRRFIAGHDGVQGVLAGAEHDEDREHPRQTENNTQNEGETKTEADGQTEQRTAEHVFAHVATPLCIKIQVGLKGLSFGSCMGSIA